MGLHHPRPYNGKPSFSLVFSSSIFLGLYSIYLCILFSPRHPILVNVIRDYYIPYLVIVQTDGVSEITFSILKLSGGSCSDSISIPFVFPEGFILIVRFSVSCFLLFRSSDDRVSRNQTASLLLPWRQGPTPILLLQKRSGFNQDSSRRMALFVVCLI